MTLCNAFGLCDTYRTSVRVVRQTRELPFFDDFSYDGDLPALEFWQDRDVFVNRDFAELPPSVGVATFDAVAFDGQPYAAAGGRPAVRDFLTSVPLDLEGRQNPVLSFFLQPRGLGFRPETQDSFRVEFLAPSGNWVSLLRVAGLRNTVPNSRKIPFEFYSIPVDPIYRYSGFQFRFSSKSAEVGVVDNWHLDYVKLEDANPGNDPRITADLAFVSEPFHFTDPYTQIPLRHFQAAPEGIYTDSVFLRFFNHRNDETPPGQTFYIIEDLNGNLPRTRSTLLRGDFFGASNEVPGLRLQTRRSVLQNSPLFVDYNRALTQELPSDADVRLAISYEINPQVENIDLGPGITENNRVTTVTRFGEVFAYDDGTAEALLEGPDGLEIVQRYTAFVPETLTGIRIRIPRGLRSLNGRNIRFVIYTGTNGVPEEEIARFDTPILFAENFFSDSLQGFTSYALDEPLDLPAGDFFIGWEQIQREETLGVGFDRNNDAAGLVFFSDGGPWQPLQARGAVMIRPLVGDAEILPTSTNDPVSQRQLIRLYPNPTQGVVSVQPLEGTGEAMHYRLFSLSGQLLAEGLLTDRLDLTDYPTGMYVLEASAGAYRSRHRIVRH